MSVRARVFSLLLLNAACASSAEGPVAMPPSEQPHRFVEANGSEPAGAPSSANTTAAETVERSPSDVRETTDHPGAPERIDTEINEPYGEQDNPRRWAKQFEREGREVADERDSIIAALGITPGTQVADVGAGTGLFTLALARSVGPTGTVFAVDVQAYFLDHIGQNASKEGLKNVTLVRATQQAVGLDPASVDLIIMVDAYHHVEQPAAYLASLHAAVRPEGRLVIIDYDREKATRAWLKDHIRADAEEFRAEIESAGFRLTDRHEGILDENFFFEFERK